MNTLNIAFIAKTTPENVNLLSKIHEHLSTKDSPTLIEGKHDDIGFNIYKSFIEDDKPLDTTNLTYYDDLHVIYANDNHEALQLINKLYFAPKNLGRMVKFMAVIATDAETNSFLKNEKITLCGKVLEYNQFKFNFKNINKSALEDLVKGILSHFTSITSVASNQIPAPVEGKVFKLFNQFKTVTIKELDNSDNMLALSHAKNLLNMKLSDYKVDGSKLSPKIKELVEGIETITVKEFLDPANDTDLKALKVSFNKHVHVN